MVTLNVKLDVDEICTYAQTFYHIVAAAAVLFPLHSHLTRGGSGVG